MKNKTAPIIFFAFICFPACDFIPEPKNENDEDSPGRSTFALKYLEDEEAKFLAIINEYRTSRNPPLPALTSSASINQAAYDYSVVMSETGWFDHTGPDGSSLVERMCAGGHEPACTGAAIMGENIAAGYSTAEAAFEGWRTSPGHNANMLAPEFLAIGIGFADVEGGRQANTWTTDFSSVVDIDGCACYEGDEVDCESESCGPGIQTCLGNCQWSDCGPPNPGVDVCDGYDNNCNGEIDEGDVCHGCVPELEICDDEDNDCDGLVDEENVCGTECEPHEEVCDANDNDCDGTVDEGCFCPEGSPERVCGYNEGICRRGIQRCEGGVWSECEGALSPRIEICDGLDNDCDGAIDERACGTSNGDGEDGDGDGDGGGRGCSVAVPRDQGGGVPALLVVLVLSLVVRLSRRRVAVKGAWGLFPALLLVLAPGCTKSMAPADTSDSTGEAEEDVAEVKEDIIVEDIVEEDVPVEIPEGAPDIVEIVEEDIPEEETGPTDIPFGAPCTGDSQCLSGLCLPAELGGRCSEECRDETFCEYEHVGTSCSPYGKDTDGNSLTDTVITACAERPPGSSPAGSLCSGPDDCHSRLCIESGMCTNVCWNDSDCVPASQCLTYTLPLDEGEGTYNACGFNPVSSITLEEYDYATLSLVMEAAGGRRRDVFVPADAVSLTITGLQTAPAQAAMVGFLEVYDPAEVEIYDMVDYFDGLDPPNWHMPWIRMGIFMVPITPRVSFMGGGYQFKPVTARFSESDPIVSVTMDFTLQIKRSPTGTVSNGTLNMNFFFVGLDSINATNAQTPGGEFQRVLGWVSSIYSAANITIGARTYTDILEPHRSLYRILNMDYDDPDIGELGGLLSLSAGRSELAVNVFLVHDIDESGVLGMSPGIPGPQGIHGTGASGVVINYDACWSERSAGMVIAHEVGHFLGLFHPTERGANPYPGDPIDDTAYGDASNLMHWQWGGDQLTAGQAFVMLRAPLVQ